MKNVFLISESFVRSMSNADDNLQGKFIQSAIRETQDMELQQVLGKKLYLKLKSLVKDNSILEPESANYKMLLDESQYFLLYSTLSKLVMISNFKISNIGVNQTEDDRVTTLNLADSFKMEDYYKKKSDFYKGKLQEFLIENKKDFVELDCCKCENELHSAASTSIFLGGRRSRLINKRCKCN